jgi:hypothetical protein
VWCATAPPLRSRIIGAASSIRLPSRRSELHDIALPQPPHTGSM